MVVPSREETVSVPPPTLRRALRTKPGATYSYANSGYSLLAAIVEIVAKQDYETALRDVELRPAGMLQTGCKLPAWPAARIAHGYQDGRDWGTIVDRIAKPGADATASSWTWVRVRLHRLNWCLQRMGSSVRLMQRAVVACGWRSRAERQLPSPGRVRS